MSFSIAGKTAIITGAANGVGLAIARHFIAEGANVMMADRDEKHLRAEMSDVADDESSARIFSCDLREKLSQANLLSATIDAFDRVDILVNASRQVLPTDPMDDNDDSVEQLLQQNLLSGMRLSQLIAKRMIKQAEDDEDGEMAGSIVNLSSIAARRSRPGLMGYSISCAALDQMTRTMAIALAPERIRVNAVAFGSVMSASLQNALKETEELRDDIIEHTPLSRIAPANEVAEAVQFLCSPSSNFITGEIMTVDGGRTLLDPVETAAH
ncbi:MAG: SDR family oxidoreductase [Litoreibacter sp.]|uniref:SDR family NAD(P)-dependent oxidoreductase n=1 Tax=Litoreibacter sp. TaxID=1969459 RepID=UPI0032989DC3